MLARNSVSESEQPGFRLITVFYKTFSDKIDSFWCDFVIKWSLGRHNRYSAGFAGAWL